jgi:hypothetical protein
MTAPREQGLRLRVEVPSAPSPYLLRAAIEARLAGRAFGAGPEDAIADAVAQAVRPKLERREERPWR